MKSPKKIQYKKEYYIRTKKQRERYYSNKKEILNKARIYYLQNRSKILKRTKDKYHADEIKFKENKDFRKIYLKRLEDIRIAHERRNRVERKEVLEAFPKIECQKCGFKDTRALQIDHINGGGNKERKSFRNPSKYYEHIKSHVDNYQLLCANCNWIKKHEEKEARKTKKYQSA